MKQKAEAFSNQKLKEMIVPLFFEQLLVMLLWSSFFVTLMAKKISASKLRRYAAILA